MNQIATFQKLVQTYCTEGMVDSLCIELGYEYETDYKIEYPEVTPEEFVRENRALPQNYQMHEIDNIRREVEEKILELKDNDVALDHYIRDILSPIGDNLGLFFSPRPFTACTAFQKLVPFLNTYNTYDELPKEMVAIHRAYIEEMVKFGFLDISPEEQESRIQKLCDNTWECFQKRKEIPSFKQCQYFRWLFQNVASMIESALLDAGCEKDLFWYQEKYDIVLYPSLTTRDLWANSVFSEEVAKQVARGYNVLDRYTEMAGYAVYDGKQRVGELITCGIPEIDALLKQTNTRMPSDYPTHHFRRNLYSFSAKCQELAESDDSLEKKQFRVRNLVHILGHCYDTFSSVPQLRNYLNYVIHFFSILESSLLRCPMPICIKGMCMDLHYDAMLTDEFPDTDISKAIIMTQKIEPGTPWEQYYLSKSLGKSLDYYESLVCEQCARENCPFRKAASKIPGAIFEQKAPPVESPVQVYAKSLIAICKYLEARSIPNLERIHGTEEWNLDHNDQLYAYIGIALERHLKRKSTSWSKMSRIIHRSGSKDYLKGVGSEYRSMFNGKMAKKFPSSYHLVDDAIDNLKNGRKRS